MARNDGIDRTTVRNVNLTAAKIGNAQRHNEREKESYVNQDIVPERTPLNIHFKRPDAGYQEMFDQMKAEGVIFTRGLKEDANLFGELIFDVNSAYFYNHGGYEFGNSMPMPTGQRWRSSAVRIISCLPLCTPTSVTVP